MHPLPTPLSPENALWPLVARQRLPRIHVISDVHLETGPYEFPQGLEFDILVAAGDIGPVEQAVPWLAALGKPVVYVMGNHEHYDRAFTETVTVAKTLAAGTQVHVLEREVVVIQGVRFLGATLWTSFGDWTPSLVQQALFRMNDYRKIRAGNWSESRSNQALSVRLRRKAGLPAAPAPAQEDDGREPPRFHPAIAYAEHVKTVRWLERELARDVPQPVVVVSHHAPTFEALRASGIHEDLLEPANWMRRRDDELVRVAAYASPLDDLLRRHSATIALWAHGHLHHAHDLLVQGVRVLCNPRGYHEKPLTAESARGYALMGLHLTEEDVARSQATFADNPFKGNGWGFQRSLVADLQHGLEHPARLALERPLEELRELRESAFSLLPYLFKGAPKQREATVRCFAADCDAFGRILETTHRKVTQAFDANFATGVLKALDSPWAPPQAPRQDPFTGQTPRMGDYQKTVARMDEWLAWLERLPLAASRGLSDWAAQAYRALAYLQTRGVAARVQRPSCAALRHANERNLVVVTAADEDVRNALEENLDQLVNGRPPRKWFISVWEQADCYHRNRGFLTMKDLRAWDQNLPLEMPAVQTPDKSGGASW